MELEEIYNDLIYQKHLCEALVEEARVNGTVELWQKRYYVLCQINKDLEKVRQDIKWYNLRVITLN